MTPTPPQRSATPAWLAALKQADPARLWRCLEELADEPGFMEHLQREHARHFDAWQWRVNRRQFLQLTGVSLLLAGLVPGCGEPPREPIVPALRPPDYVPGRPLVFATALSCGDEPLGVLVRSDDGRPTKVEGNPRHPGSLGAAHAIAQAQPFALYDPDRSQSVMHLGRISSWAAAEQALDEQRARWERSGGDGVRILTGTLRSPTLRAQLAELRRRLPNLRWHEYDPLPRDHALQGAQQAFGQFALPQYHLDRAAVVVALDCDLLHTQPGHLRLTRQLMSRRRHDTPASQRNRLYVAEPMPTVTGATADHRLPVQAKRVALLAGALAARLQLGHDPHMAWSPAESRWLDHAADDLLRHRGAGVLAVGPCQPPEVHALAHRLNHALGNLGATVTLLPAADETTLHMLSLRHLTADLQSRLVQTLIVLDANPVYTAPADLEFARHLMHVPLRVHLGLYQDETAELSQWHLPMAHELETWGDLQARDGTVSLQQPLIAPLYGGRSALEVMAVLLQRSARGGYELVRDHWRGRLTPGDGAGFDTTWRQALIDGVVPGAAHEPLNLTPTPDEQLPRPALYPDDGTLELRWQPDPLIHDGRHANNGWLQECPKPITKLTWDNAAMISPATAAARGIDNGRVLLLRFAGRELRAPAWIVPGHADGSVTIHLGYGRTRGGNLARGAGFNAYALQRSVAPWFDQGLALEVTRERYPLATTQTHQVIEGRDLLRVMSADAAAQTHEPEHDAHAGQERRVPLTLYPEKPMPGPQWGMAIDLTACTGCQACVVACQVENNVPVVGKQEVLRGRAMHWLRIDRYFAGPPHDPAIHQQPVLCMHCENAPCEPPCPVGATVHSHDGLNDMVYNRCIGTRYCSNNCPYKVRRFNFFGYAPRLDQQPQALRHNPQVTVRSRGVMEKCTFCVQRIRAAEIDARVTDTPLQTDSFTTACAAACASQAIVFGNIADPNSRVSQLKALERHYGMLAELGTRPRVGYLPRVINPHSQEPRT